MILCRGYAPKKFLTLVAGVAALVSFASITKLEAQTTRRFDSGVVAGGDWLQANALPMDRDALHSLAANVSYRRRAWALEAGWLRVARTLSTVQGGSLSGGPLLHWGPVLFIPAIGVLGGQAQESRDTTGYDWVDAQGVMGHVARYTHSSAASFGGGAQLTIEIPVYRAVGFHARVGQWYFTGAPLEGDRARTVVGAGLSLRLTR